MLKGLFGRKKTGNDATRSLDRKRGKKHTNSHKGEAQAKRGEHKVQQKAKLKDSGDKLNWLPGAVPEKSEDFRGKGENRGKSARQGHKPRNSAPRREERDEEYAPRKIKVAQRNPGDANDDSVYFFALGGMDQVGMNMYVYKLHGKYLIVDAGFGFSSGYEGDEGADTRYPDTAYLEQVKKDVVGIVVTHGHEDHIGAIKHIWPKFRCPIYCTRFVEKTIRKDFDELGIETKQGDFRVFNHTGDKFAVDPFNVETFHVSHSLPEANMVVISTPQGKILHSGDWTFNDGIPIEMPTDYKRLAEIGSDPDLLALVNDSTEISRGNLQTTELEVKETLKKLFEAAPQRVLMTCYSRSIARLKMAAEAAKETGRVCSVKGRSLITFREIGIELGYLDADEILVWDDVRDLPADKQVVLCTGSQGEKYALLTRLCRGEVREMKLTQTDTVIFSAIIIPGNELEVSGMYNKLAKVGCHVHTIFDTEKLHANGHAGAPEYRKFYEMVHPFVAIPMHGMYVSEMLNVKMAVEIGGAKHMAMVKNGEILRLRRGETPEIVDKAHTGVIIKEGETELAANDVVFKNRQKILLSGAVFVTLSVDRKGYLKDAPEVSSAGIFESDSTGAMKRSVQVAITRAIDQMDKDDRRSEDALMAATRAAVNSALRPQIGRQKRPNIIVHLVYK
ncbi:MAG: ribonuclease J [Rickettsiales bacterium]|jgi:ribonuclease J|nr:ribonuclease J [Rickettsiales bacterium]